jgi:hypothetical protein
LSRGVGTCASRKAYLAEHGTIDTPEYAEEEESNEFEIVPITII